jgi:uncharacterized sulfatase
LDSLSSHSLVWNNNLSGAERTYGALPNILGSLPYGGKRGFIRSSKYNFSEYPSHTSLIGELKKNGYSTEFIYGGDSHFDQMWHYLNAIGIEKFTTKDELKQLAKNKEDCAWGFSDYIMFEKAAHSKIKEPFCKIILTTGIHSPFDQGLSAKKLPKCNFDAKIESAILKSDQNIKEYFALAQQDNSFQNTIFIITGDHNIGDLKLKNPLETFHTPLIIYSPLLLKPQTFQSIVSHRDIVPSLCALLANNYGLAVSDSTTFIGQQLNVSNNFDLDYTMPLCLYQDSKNVNLIAGKYFLIGTEVYQITDAKLNAQKINMPKILHLLQNLKTQMESRDASAMRFGLQKDIKKAE